MCRVGDVATGAAAAAATPPSRGVRPAAAAAAAGAGAPAVHVVLVVARRGELPEERHEGAVREEVVAVLRRRHRRVAVVRLHVDVLEVLDPAHHEAGEPGPLPRMPRQRNAHEPLEVAAALVVEGPVVLLAVLAPGAPGHLALREPRLAPIVEEDAVEDAEVLQRRLPRPLDHTHARLVRRPSMQAPQHRLGALDDRVRAGPLLLDPLRAEAAAEAHLEDIASAVDGQVPHALLHIRLLPFHHDLRPVHVQQLLVAVPVLGEGETVGPLAELRALRIEHAPLASAMQRRRRGLEGGEDALAKSLQVERAVRLVLASAHLRLVHLPVLRGVPEDAVEGAQTRQARLPRALDHDDAGAALRPLPQPLQHDAGALDDDMRRGPPLLNRLGAVAQTEPDLEHRSTLEDHELLGRLDDLGLVEARGQQVPLRVGQLLLALLRRPETQTARPLLETTRGHDGNR
mmetsp:Transcript_7069/g.20077  ORF Transcript_7069/g.20077 Transcript_7069/m.20077 type:complete len:458 (-) Transcript_7069:98-1471(-)